MAQERTEDAVPQRSGYQFKRELAFVLVVASPVVVGTAWALASTVIGAYHSLSSNIADHDTKLALYDEFKRTNELLEAEQQLQISKLHTKFNELNNKVIIITTHPDSRDDRLRKLEEKMRGMQ